MKHLRNAVLGLTILGSESQLTAADAPRNLLSCWDQTFAYNAFGIEETDLHYYITLRGSTLIGSRQGTGNEQFRLFGTHEDFVVPSWDSARSLITIAYTKDECIWNAVARTVRCSTGVPSEFRTSVFVTRNVDDLGNPVTITSTFVTGQVDVTGDSNGLLLTKTEAGGIAQQLSVTEPEVTNPPVGLDCGLPGNNSFLDATVPQRLVNHLEP